MSDPVTRLNAALEGRYAIERKLGEGGMATVYLADDLKHERKVALKVLKPELAAVVGAERFLGEIKTTANLQHPHILPLFDSGEADGFLFYVMPYIEGETLEDRIKREKQLPVDESLGIATAVANALQTAHEAGVIHRDIKPANILLSRGEPLVADFGIALAVGVAGGSRLTETGLSVGTPFYMSPEQATGDQILGPATDTYALACVLYEMLVGEPPYLGNTAQAVLGKIIQGLPVSATSVRASIPPNVDAAIRKALEKIPADRFTRAKDFANALADPGFRHGEEAAAGLAAGAGPWKRVSMALGAVAIVSTLGLGWSLLRDAPGPVTRVSVHIPEDQYFEQVRGHLDLSSDGSLMVYRGPGDVGAAQLWARRWNELDATPIRGTDRGEYPAISPDGQEIAFQQVSSIVVIPLQGGVSRTVAEGGLCCPRWSPDGAWIYYSEPNASGGLWRVPAGGGSPEVVTEANSAAGDQVNVMPDVLPGGRGVVFMTGGPDGRRIQAVDVETGDVTDLTPGTYPRYSPTGHLLFIDDDATLMAAPFDVESLELTGAAVPVAEGLAVSSRGTGFFAVSQTGTLVYRTGASGGLVRPLWVERDGVAREIDPQWTFGAPGNSGPALSPDGASLALSIIDTEDRSHIWVKQLDTGPSSRITFEGQQTIRPRWSPDGQFLIFLSNRAGNYDVWTKRADGSDTAELVLDRELDIQGAMYSPDGSWLLFREGLNEAADIYAVRLPMDSAVVPLEVTDSQERAFSLSPDGRWLAFVSNRLGLNEVFVRPFPEAGTSLRQVSVNGGTEPKWAHSGRELFYVNGDGELVAIQVSTDPTFAAGPQEVLFSVADYMRNPAQAMYDVALDDQQFVMLRLGDTEDDPSEFILVENWADEFLGRTGN